MFTILIFVINLFTFGQCQSVANEYRTLNGTGNNLINPYYGSRMEPYLFCPNCIPNYIDGQSPEWNKFPSSRSLTNSFIKVPHVMNPRYISDMHVSWGLMLHGDLSAAAKDSGEKVPIPVPLCDTWFDPDCTGKQTIDFSRLKYINVTHQGKSVRAPYNEQTLWLDGSWIYGPNQEIHSRLREYSGGRMKLDKDGLLPKYDGSHVPANTLKNDNQRRMSGFWFANLYPPTVAIPSIMIREHNRLANQFSTQNPSWDDEKIFQEARRRVIAMIQVITYRQYLPVITGKPLPAYTGYDQNVRPYMDRAWMTAAFRYGHSELVSTILRLDKQFAEIPEGNLIMRDCFLQPSKFIDRTGVEPILRGLSTTVARSVGLNVIEDLRNYFLTLGITAGIDLIATDIQRTRDVGLPLYNDAREFYGLKRVKSFEEISKSLEVLDVLKTHYRTVDDIELYVGGLAEDHVEGASLGELFITIVNAQFDILRRADRFWYENNQFTSDEVYELEHTTLSTIITRNTNNTDLQSNVFFVPAERVNGKKSITLPDPDPYFEGHALMLNPNYRFSWKAIESKLIIQLEVATLGWFGIGFNPDATKGFMVKADIVMCNSSATKVTCQDMYSYQIGPPQTDVSLGGKSNIDDLQYIVTNTYVSVRFSRPLNSDDIYDNPILFSTTTRIIYAYNEMTDFLSYHGPNRGSQIINIGVDSTQGKADSFPSWMIILLIVLVCVISLGLLIGFIYVQKKKSKILSSFPKGNVAIAFTDIENSTYLWDQYPFIMKESLEVHNQLIRSIIKKYKICEVKTQGDSFMMVSSSIADMVRCALEIQTSLITAKWDLSLLEINEYKPTRVMNDLTWRGLRVRIGIHIGHPQVEVNRRKLTVDYLGPSVNLAARVESVAKGGEICISSDAFEAIQDLILENNILVQDLGSHKLKGIDQPQQVYVIFPNSLNGRLRSDKKVMSTEQVHEPDFLNPIKPRIPGSVSRSFKAFEYKSSEMLLSDV